MATWKGNSKPTLNVALTPKLILILSLRAFSACSALPVIPFDSSRSANTILSKLEHEQLSQVMLHVRGGSGERGSAFGVHSDLSAVVESLDMNRVRIRLEGLSTYAVVSALMLNGSLRLLFGTPKNLEKDKRTENVVKVVFCASTFLSILSSVYTTVVFSLLGSYCKTALGLSQDSQYVLFMNATAKERRYAFDAFLWSLGAFQTSFVSSLFLNYQGPLRWWSSGVSGLLVVWSFRHWTNIMKLARHLIFSKQ
jgi:hypothetical protein